MNKKINVLMLTFVLLSSGYSYSQQTITIKRDNGMLTYPSGNQSTITVKRDNGLLNYEPSNYNYPTLNAPASSVKVESYEEIRRKRQEDEMRQLQIERARLENERLRRENNAANSGNNSAYQNNNVSSTNSSNNSYSNSSYYNSSAVSTMSDYDLFNIINSSINSEKYHEAISYLKQAISRYPESAELYDAIGRVYETIGKNDEAITFMKRALAIIPNNIDYLSHLGRIYFNLGVEKHTLSDKISDLYKSNEIAAQSRNYFRESMPFFEKVFELDTKNTVAIYALRSIYHSLDMNSKYQRMDAIYNSNSIK